MWSVDCFEQNDRSIVSVGSWVQTTYDVRFLSGFQFLRNRSLSIVYYPFPFRFQVIRTDSTKQNIKIWKTQQINYFFNFDTYLDNAKIFDSLKLLQVFPQGRIHSQMIAMFVVFQESPEFFQSVKLSVFVIFDGLLLEVFVQLRSKFHLQPVRVESEQAFQTVPVSLFRIFESWILEFGVHSAIEIFTQEKWPKTEKGVHLVWLTNSKAFSLYHTKKNMC